MSEIWNEIARRVRARLVQEERERIIKLLEGYFKPDEAKSIYPANYEQYLDLVELIKGEQK